MTQDHPTLPLELDNRTIMQIRGALTGNGLSTNALNELTTGNLRGATGPLHMLISGISQLINDGRTVDLNNPRVLEVVLRGQIEIIGVYTRMLVQIGLPADDPAIKAVALLKQTFDMLFPPPAAEVEERELPEPVSEYAVLEPIGAMAAALATQQNYEARRNVLCAIITFAQHMLDGRFDDLELPANNVELLDALERLVGLQNPHNLDSVMRALQRARILAQMEVEAGQSTRPLTTLSSDGSGVRG
jgi:hypothetical protein